MLCGRGGEHKDIFEVTEKEKYVLKKLHERVDKITGGKTPNLNLVKSIVTSCSAWNFPIVFENDDPKEIANVCKALLNKGLIKQFYDKEIPSFVPTTRTEIVEYKYRDFLQSDVW